MFRKLILAFAATASIGAASLATTPASAHWHGGGWGWHHSHFWGGPRFVSGGPIIVGGSCLRRQLVATPWGYRYRTVNICY